MDFYKCPVCKKDAPDSYKPKGCCSGFECGCMGMPIEPYLCSKECQNKFFNGVFEPIEEPNVKGHYIGLDRGKNDE